MPVIMATNPKSRNRILSNTRADRVLALHSAYPRSFSALATVHETLPEVIFKHKPTELTNMPATLSGKLEDGGGR